MIQAKILADSKSVRGERITTFLLTFPRIILAEFNTHRAFSRNSASSRAIPFKKMVESVETNPFIPIAWQKDHKGMQGTEYITSKDDIENCISVWLKARNDAVKQSICLNGAEGFDAVTKQLCNRLLEPFMWHTVICTATDYQNFFNLRCPEYLVSWYPSDRPEALEPTQGSFKSKKDAIARTEGECNDLTEKDWRECNISQAEIHIQALAEAMWDAMNESTPKVLGIGEWHIPFANTISHGILEDEVIFKDPNWKKVWIDPHEGNPEYDEYVNGLNLKIATAKCARVSYTTVGSTSNSSHTADIELHNRLIESGHYSPLEHCAQVMCETDYYERPWSRNFKGFMQYREIVETTPQ
jgi:thymidylate synthase ThyX